MTGLELAVGGLTLGVLGLGFRIYQFKRNHLGHIENKLSEISERLSTLEGAFNLYITTFHK